MNFTYIYYLGRHLYLGRKCAKCVQVLYQRWSARSDQYKTFIFHCCVHVYELDPALGKVQAIYHPYDRQSRLDREIRHAENPSIQGND